MHKFILSISCILLILLLSILHFIANTSLYINNKEYQEKHKYKYIITIIIQIILFVHLIWQFYYRFINKNHLYLGYKEYK